MPTDESSPAYMLPGYRAEAEARREAETRASALEENFHGLQTQYRAALEQLKALDQKVLMQESSTSQTESDVQIVRDELQQTAERLHRIEVDREAIRERLTLRQSELDAAEGRALEAETRSARTERELDHALSELERIQGSFHMSKLQEALLELDGGAEDQNGNGNGGTSTPRLILRPETDEMNGVVPAARKVG
jgi:chromosome segregation ATPase